MKKFLIIALIALMIVVLPVSAVNEYRDMNPAKGLPDVNTFQNVIFQIRAGGSAEDLVVFYHRVTDEQNESVLKASFDNRFNPDRTDVGKQNDGWATEKVLPDGESAPVVFATGKFIAAIRNGEGGQTEFVVFDVAGGNGAPMKVQFLGHAVSSRANPMPASIDASFGCRDIEVTHWKIVKTGQHWIAPEQYEYCYRVIDVPAYDTYDGDYVDMGGYYEYSPSDSQANYVVETASRDRNGGYKKVGNHYEKIGAGHYHWDRYSVSFKLGTATHHPATYKTVCEQRIHPGYMQPDYGIEFFLEIDGAKVAVNNPNHDPVNVEFNFDINYFVDKRPWDTSAMPRDIAQRTKNYRGSIQWVGQGVTTYHGYLTPDIDNAVAVLDFESFGVEYLPTISNEQVTATVWSH